MVAPSIVLLRADAFGCPRMGRHDRRQTRTAGDRQRPVRCTSSPRIETLPNIKQDVKKEFGFEPDFRGTRSVARGEHRGGEHLQSDRQAGAHRNGRRRRYSPRSFRSSSCCRRSTGRRDRRAIYEGLVHHELALSSGLFTGGAVIYWLSGHRARRDHRRLPGGAEFIRRINQARGRGERASVADSKKVRRDLHAVRAEGGCSHLLVVFFSHPVLSPA